MEVPNKLFKTMNLFRKSSNSTKATTLNSAYTFYNQTTLIILILPTT